METYTLTEPRMSQEPENIDVDRVVRDINASVADVLTRSLGPYIQMASESTAQCSAVSHVLRKLPEFQTLLEEKLQLAAEVAELRTRLATAESSGIKLRVSEFPSTSSLIYRDASIANLAENFHPTISQASSPYRDSLSEDESDESSEPMETSEMPIDMEGLLAAARRQPNLQCTPQSVTSISDNDVNTSTVFHDDSEIEDDETIRDEEIAPSFPSHPLAAHVEIAMEEEEAEEEELYEIELVLPGHAEPTAFYTPDAENGAIYEIDDDEAPGEEVGRLENGVPNWTVE